MTEQTTGVDTRDMVTVHDALRREYALMPDLVRGVAAGDRERIDLVADHVAFCSTLLHHHHQGEDRLLWPVLMPRVDEQAKAVVEQMEQQHEGIHEANNRADAALATWRASGTAADGATLAAALEEVDARVREHLAAEETVLLPLASRHLDQDEWNKLGEAGMGGTPKKQLPLVFGMIMYRADPAVIREMLTHIPLVPRLILPRVAPRIRARYMTRLYGTPNPA